MSGSLPAGIARFDSAATMAQAVGAFLHGRDVASLSGSPMLDKTMSGAYPPGSTFKPFSALAALEDRIIDPREKVKCDGYYAFGRRIWKCTHVHGKVNMHDAIAESCNIYFFKLAEVVGMDRIARIASD